MLNRILVVGSKGLKQYETLHILETELLRDSYSSGGLLLCGNYPALRVVGTDHRDCHLFCGEQISRYSMTTPEAILYAPAGHEGQGRTLQNNTSSLRH